MKKAKYICFEGTEGVGKTTQTTLLAHALRSKGLSVLMTKEPGSMHSPLTMTLRGIMLDNKYDVEMTKPAREFISQAIRSVHLEQVIVPALSKYDFIIQDRGILSGYAYGAACGNDMKDLQRMAQQNIESAYPRSLHFDTSTPELIYDSVIYLIGDHKKGLEKALSAKQEFETGDAMESRGSDFIKDVSYKMNLMSGAFNTVKIEVDGKSIDEVHSAILRSLNL
jgi:dTMP kinase